MGADNEPFTVASSPPLASDRNGRPELPPLSPCCSESGFPPLCVAAQFSTWEGLCGLPATGPAPAEPRSSLEQAVARSSPFPAWGCELDPIPQESKQFRRRTGNTGQGADIYRRRTLVSKQNPCSSRFWDVGQSFTSTCIDSGQIHGRAQG